MRCLANAAAVFWADDSAALPNEGEAFGQCRRDKLGPLPLPPNSGLPEFGTLSRPKSDKSDFGWERVREARSAHFGQTKPTRFGPTKPRSGAWKKDHLRLWETIVGSVPLFRVGRLHRHRWDDDHS